MELNEEALHWAARSPIKLAREVYQRFEDFLDKLRASGDYRAMMDSADVFFGYSVTGGQARRIVTPQREEQEGGSARYLMDNEYGSATRRLVTLATEEPSGFTPVAPNNDAATQGAVTLARALLEHYSDTLKVDETVAEAITKALVCLWSWVDVPWVEDAGPVAERKPVLDEMGEPTLAPPERLGDVTACALLPTQVAFHVDSRSNEPLQWVIIESWCNRWDVVAEIRERMPPEEAESAVRKVLSYQHTRPMTLDELWSSWRRGMTTSSSVDEVPVYELRHMKTRGCPEGRHFRVVAEDVVLEDGPCKYHDSKGLPELGCVMVTLEKRFGCQAGYSPTHHALGPQTAVDVAASTAYSNLRVSGHTTVVAPSGMPLSSATVGGIRVLNYTSMGPNPRDNAPIPLDVGKMDQRIFDALSFFTNRVDGHMGLDEMSMGRGAMPSSGSLGALLADRTARATASVTRLFDAVRKQVYEAILRRLAAHVTTSRHLPLAVGKSRPALLGDYSGEMLMGVESAELEKVSNVQRTVAGRMEIGRLMLESAAKGLPAEAVMKLVTTGQYEPLLTDMQSEELTVQGENDKLLAGEPLEGPGLVTAFWGDNPVKHLLGHRAVLASPEARRNPAIVANTRAHMEAHVRDGNAWMAGDPLMWMLHGPPPGQPVPEDEDEDEDEDAPGAPPQQGEPGQPSPGLPTMPSMPTNPATGEQAPALKESTNG